MGKLTLSRKAGDSVVLEGIGEVKVVEIKGNQVKLCFDVDPKVRIVRKELRGVIACKLPSVLPIKNKDGSVTHVEPPTIIGVWP